MKNMTWMIVFILLTITIIVPVSAQDNPTILQLSVPFFTEDILQPVVDEFTAENPGIQVQLVPYQGFGIPVEDSDDPEEYLDNLAGYFSSADVLLVDSSFSSDATRAGYVLDLSPLTQSDASYNEAEFQPAVLHSFEWDGGQWALPISTSFVVVSYIPAAFDAAGLAYPDGSWTLDDLEFAARTLTQYDAEGNVTLPGMLVQGNDNLSTLFVSLLGQGVYSDVTFPASPDFSNPALATYLDTWLMMTNDGLFELPEDADNDDVPMIIGTPFGFGGGPFGGQDDDAPERATALLPGGRAGLDVTGYAVSRGTLYPDAAYRLIMFLIHNPNAVAASVGTVSAVQGLEEAEAPQGGPGFFGGNNVPEELAPLVDDALLQGIPVAERRFSEGIVTALSLMQDDGLDAGSALAQVQTEYTTLLTTADARVTATPITVAAPAVVPQLAAGEVAINFAILGGGGGGGGGAQFAALEQWQAVVDEFAASDAQVGFIHVDTENQNQLNEVTQNYDCFYANTNLVPNADLSQLLNLDPLMSTDATLAPNDFISNVFQQVKANNQTWAFPLQISPLVLRFNYDIYNQAGINPPQGSWTVDEFEDALRQIKFVVAEDQTSVELNIAAQSALIALIASYGGLPFDTRTDPATVSFSDPATMGAIQQVLNLAQQGYLSYTSGQGGGFVAQADSSIPIYSGVVNAFSFGGFGGGNNVPQPNTDGIMTFPRGTQFNAVPVNVGTAYISATTQQAEGCYRFIRYVSESADLFDSMPARHSAITSQALLSARGEQTVAFFQSLADLMEEPTTILVPTNINAGNFGMTNWLFGVFDRYIAGEVVDLEADLREAEQITRDYLMCVAAIPPIDPAQGDIQSFFEQVNACQTAADPTA
jgi:ABC-type glycerol-3-phosphate transport system substrate-binding protein